MRIVYTIVSLAAILLLGGCITSSAINEATTTTSAYFFPEQVWRDSSSNEFLITGFKPTETGGGKIPCFVRVSTSKLKEFRDEKNEILLSRIGSRGVAELRLEIGPVPEGYVLVPSTPMAGLISITDEKKTVHPTRFAVVPFTIVLDVVTLPVQLVVGAGLSGIN